MADHLAIGRFGRLCGLSVEALRHYDELGVLRPASIDAATGYRRYDPEQLTAGRAIARLRSLDVPLSKVAAYLTTRDVDERRRLLQRHLADVEARLARSQHIAHGLRRLIDDQEDLVTAPAPTTSLSPEGQRRLAVELFNHVWTLLETIDRTPDQDDEMLHAAHASRYHWGVVGDAANRTRGEWQCSRVYAILGRAEPALHHARRCLELCEANQIGDWDLAAAYEALARACRVAGDDAGLARYRAAAQEALGRVADPEDAAIIAPDVASLA
jgi:DNA-binding transcriptional MerR regulator